jgi:L-fucose isomerase-like protein
MFKNVPEVKLGVVAVSRDCFPIALSVKRKAALLAAGKKAKLPLCDIKTVIENEKDSLKALDELHAAGCNALLVFLGNFGPEGPETLVAQRFPGPVMFYAAAEEDANDLINGRGDAYCGMLNASYNLKLKGIRAYIPEYPVGDADDAAREVAAFLPVARAIIGIRNLKLISFGPRPYDFLACNAPIAPLFDLGINVQENSELDLLVSYRKHEADKRIPAVVKDMQKELGKGGGQPDLMTRLAQFELTLLDWLDANLGASKFVAFANKCWPSFQTEFRFCPCYINSRLASRLIPVSCEVDIYGAITEYIISCVTQVPPTLLDINNSVPKNLYNDAIRGAFDYALEDTFMGFHCGNTPACHLQKPAIKYQLIMKRALEPDREPDITRGTLEGDLKPGEITFFRVQSTPDCRLQSYIAEGEVLPVATRSFGGIGVFAIPEMGRFYRHVLLEKGYPHHGGVAFAKAGKALFEVVKYLGIGDIAFNQPKSLLYKTENPFQ